MSGQEVVRSSISAISKAEQCEVTTSTAHGCSTGNFVRITDLGEVGPATDRGFEQINGNRYLVYVTSTTTFLLRDPITEDYIDSTDYTTYVSGGSVNLIQTNFEYEGD